MNKHLRYFTFRPIIYNGVVVLFFNEFFSSIRDNTSDVQPQNTYMAKTLKCLSSC